MEHLALLGLPLPIWLAFVVLVAGLVLLARQLHRLHRSAVVLPAPRARGD